MLKLGQVQFARHPTPEAVSRYQFREDVPFGMQSDIDFVPGRRPYVGKDPDREPMEFEDPVGYVNPYNHLRSYYGDSLDSELGKADRYLKTSPEVKALGVKTRDWNFETPQPYAPGASRWDLVHPKDNPAYTADVPVFRRATPAFTNIFGERAIGMPFSHEGGRGLDKQLDVPMGVPSRASYNPPFSHSSRGVLGHELSHLYDTSDATPPYARGIRRLKPEYTGSLTYPERDPGEFAPPAGAIQRYLFSTTGKRLESPEAYDSWIKSVEPLAVDRSKMPMEVQRWLNYRDHARRPLAFDDSPDISIKAKAPGPVKPGVTRPTPQPATRQYDRVKYHDDTMRTIIPGVVGANTASSNAKTASCHPTMTQLVARLAIRRR